MQVNMTRHIDASDPDTGRNHDWIYECDLISFIGDEVHLVARSYVDTPDEVTLVRLESASGTATLGAEHLDLPLVGEAVRWLLTHGKSRVLYPGGEAGAGNP